MPNNQPPETIPTIAEVCDILRDSGFTVTPHFNSTYEVKATSKVDVNAIRRYASFRENVDRVFPGTFVWVPIADA